MAMPRETAHGDRGAASSRLGFPNHPVRHELRQTAVKTPP